MKIRKSFVVRWLKTFDSNEDEHSIIDLEHIQSGNTWRVSSIEDATDMMKQVSIGETVGGQDSNIDL